MSDDELDFGEDLDSFPDPSTKNQKPVKHVEYNSNDEEFDFDDEVILPEHLKASGLSGIHLIKHSINLCQGKKVEVFSEDYENALKDIESTVNFYKFSKAQNPYTFDQEKNMRDINHVIAEYKRLSLENDSTDLLDLHSKMNDVDVESKQTKRNIQQFKVF
jgi:hypothetical protein